MSLRVRLLFNFPTYKVLAVSIVSIIVGVASISLSVVGLVNQIWGHYVATGIWSGSVMAITGFFGIASAQTRGVCVVKTFMMFSVFSFLVSLGVIALSVGGLISKSEFYIGTIYRHPNTKIIHGLLLGTGHLQAILSLICSVICIKHVCCRPKPKGPSTDIEQVRTKFRRGDERSSQSSSAPLMSRHKREKDRSVEQEAVPDEASTSASGHCHSDSKPRHSRSKSTEDKKRHKSKSPGRSTSNGSRRNSTERERQHSSDRGKRQSSADRDRRHSSERGIRNTSPDRYANKPNRDTEAGVQNDIVIEPLQACEVHTAGRVVAESSGHQKNNENTERLIVHNNLPRLPAYEEVIKDNTLNDSVHPLSISENEFIDCESVSLSSHDLSIGATCGMGSTQLKEIDAEQEALLCLSEAIQSPMVSTNSGISNFLSDPQNRGPTFDSISENSNFETEDVRKLSTNLVINSQNASEDDDEQCAPSLSVSERRVLLQKYRSSNPDPQGVIYKEFSRHSDIIKERIDDLKPKRSKSFQHNRERDFAKGKSVSARHLAVDLELPKENFTEGQIGNEFRKTSKSFSRSSSIPNKPPPKPPRTSSLKQTIGLDKERPKSATLPYSQFALMQHIEDGDNKTESEKNKTGDTEVVINKIQPPRFRYQRSKLTSETFKGPFKNIDKTESAIPSENKIPQASLEKETEQLQIPMCSGEKTQTRETLDNSHTNKSEEPLSICKDSKLMTLPPFESQSSNVRILQSPLKSPTDYSGIPLKEILLKGQGSTSTTRRRSDLECVSSSSEDEKTEESSAPSAENSENAELNNDDLGHNEGQDFSDTEGKPMYSFVL